jgi:ELWxxDGT repeat protein
VYLPVLRVVSLALALAGLGIGSSSVQAQPAFRVRDINPGAVPLASPFGQELVQVGGVAFFAASDGVHGTELWRSDGTAAGTKRLGDLCPGFCSADPRELTVLGTAVYFTAWDGLRDRLWKSDGTPAGTVATNVTAGVPLEMTAHQGSLFFWGIRNNNNALWKSNGAAGNTVVLKELPAGNAGIPEFLGAIGGTLFFIGHDATNGYELWRTDGTTAGTVLVKDIHAGSEPSLAPGFSRAVAAGGRLVFAAEDGLHGRELWASDGTAAGTVLLQDAWAGAASSEPSGLTAAGGTVFFQAIDEEHGAELWKSDGTAAGTGLVGDLNPGSGWSSPRALTAVGTRLFFRAYQAGTGRQALWTSDGTEAGTLAVATLTFPSDLDLYNGDVMAALGDRLLLFAGAVTGTEGLEPWTSDGTTAGTLPLGDLEPGTDGSFGAGDGGPRGIVLDGLGGAWLFAARTTAGGWALWRTDGTPDGTQPVLSVHTQTSSLEPVDRFGYEQGLRRLADLDGTLLFTADDGAAGAELWKSDGTAAGTVQVGDLQPGAGSSRPRELTVFDGRLLFAAAGAPDGLARVWRSDGTAAGTERLETAGTEELPWNVERLTAAGDRLFFSGYNWDQGSELWSTDGTAAGTGLVSDLSPGWTSFYPTRLTAFGGTLLFASSIYAGLWRSDGTPAGTGVLPLSPEPFPLAVASSWFFGSAWLGASGQEPWRSDGTPAGTRQIADVRPGVIGSVRDYDPFFGHWAAAPLGDRVLFLADDGPHGQELWVSDGTAAGTALVKDVRPGSPASGIDQLTPAGDEVYFIADDGVHGRELWVSDGTAAGTRLVADVFAGAGSSLPGQLTPVGPVLLFAAYDPEHGVEPWRTDGTAAGTWRIQDIAPGAATSDPIELTASGSNIYFFANDNTSGFELWAMPRTALGAHLAATKEVSGKPFSGSALTYTLRVTNDGFAAHPDLPGPEMTDVLPAALTLTGATADAGTVGVDLAANTVTWNGALAAGASATVTIQAVLETGFQNTVVANQATLSFDADGDGVRESSGASDAPAALGAANATAFTAGTGFYTVPPCRVFDTRSGSPLGTAPRRFAVGGSCGIPATALAVTANLTAVGATDNGHVVAWPAGTAEPRPGRRRRHGPPDPRRHGVLRVEAAAQVRYPFLNPST